jgi:hypothetical protein
MGTTCERVNIFPLAIQNTKVPSAGKRLFNDKEFKVRKGKRGAPSDSEIGEAAYG